MVYVPTEIITVWYTEEAGGVILTIATVAIASCAYIFGQGERFQKAPIKQE